MFVHERQAAILDRVHRSGRISVDRLMLSLGVSRSTLRRDLLELEERGDLVRVHGGVVHPSVLRGESSLVKRQQQHTQAKRAIARAAADLVPPDATVFVDAGSTTLEAGRLLAGRRDVRVFTNSLPLLSLAAQEQWEGVVGVGGSVRPVSGALVGTLALDWLGKLRFDFAFIGASGLDVDGVSTTELSEAAVKKAAAARSAKAVLLCDSSKTQASAVHFADWDAFATWVTDSPPVACRRAAQIGGVRVVTA